MTVKTDVLVIGGGVIGTGILRELSRYDIDTILVEKDLDVANGTSKANSAVVHSGLDAKPGTLKARFNVEGNALYPKICDELDVFFKKIGSLIVAFNEEDEATLEGLMERGVKNGVPGLEMVDSEWLKEKEPNLSTDAKSALWAPTAGITCPYTLTIAQAENAVVNGAKIMLGTRVDDLIVENGRVVGVHTNKGEIRSKWVINAAGVYADAVMRMAGIDKFTINPRKGEYFLLDKSLEEFVNTVIFPTPTKVSKGILVLPTVHGNILMGPNSIHIDEKENTATTPAGLEEVFNGATLLFPALSRRDTITQFTGLRASGNTGDFLIEVSPEIKGLINVAGIESPGLTAAPAISRHVVELLRGEGEKLPEKEDFNPKRKRTPEFSELSEKERTSLISKDPQWGRVICRCETITEKEIIDAIKSPVPALTIDAVKRRTRAGMGRCQGGFCMPRVAEIISRETGIPLKEIKKSNEGSKILVGKTKEVLG